MAKWEQTDAAGFVMAAEPIYAGIYQRGRGEWAWHVSRGYVWLRSGTCRTKRDAMAKCEPNFKSICRTYADEIAAAATVSAEG